VAEDTDLKIQKEEMTKEGGSRRDLVWGLAILFLALTLRLFFQWEIKDHPLSRQLFLDPAFYDHWARAISAGDWLGEGVFYGSPLYPYFLALIYKMIGHTILGVKIIQSVLGAGLCVMLALIGRRVFDRNTGILAGLMAAIYAPFIFYEGTITISTLGLFLCVLTVLLLISGHRPGPGRSLGAGVVWGLRALARVDATFFAALVWLLAYGRGRSFRRRVLPALLFCLGTAVVILPVTVRNIVVGGKMVLITAHGGETFYAGNNPRASGTYAPAPGVRPGTEWEHEDFRRLASRRVGRQLSLAESSSFWFGQAVDFIREQPGQYLRLQLRKFLLFWGPREIPDNRNFHFFRRLSIVLRLALLDFTILCPIALMGLIIGLKTWRRSLLLYLQVFLSMISVLLFFVSARYRLTAVPFLILFAAYALRWSFARIGERRWGLLTVCWLPVLLLIIFFAVIQGRGLAEKGFVSRYETMGVALIREGRVDEGIAELGSVLQLDPGKVTAHFNLGVAYLEEKKAHYLAAEELKAVIRLHNGYPQVHYMLGRTYRELGWLEQAVGEFQQELGFFPDEVQVRLELGMVFVEMERWAEAKRQFRQVISQQDGDPLGHKLLGNVLYLKGKAEEAMASWERAVQLNPADAELSKTMDSLRERLEKEKSAAP